MERKEELSDEQWAIIKPLIPPVPQRQDGSGTPWRDNREVLNGILEVIPKLVCHIERSKAYYGKK
jgi:transposase